MSFISLTFALFFFAFVCLYHLAARLFKDAPLAQRILLLAASLVFYAWADLRFVPFLAYAVAVSYLGGLSFCIGGGIGAFAFSHFAPRASRRSCSSSTLRANFIPT